MYRLVVILLALWPGFAVAQAAPTAAQIRTHYDAEYASLDPLPQLVLDAFMVAEDKYFLTHALTNSTITRWIARGMLRPGQGGTVHFATTATVASALSRQEVLNYYAQGVYMGLGCYGARDAAFAYYGKPPDALSLAEIAYLAVLPKAPVQMHPQRNPTRAIARRNWLLQEMARLNMISFDQAHTAEAAPLGTQSPLRRCDG